MSWSSARILKCKSFIFAVTVKVSSSVKSTGIVLFKRSERIVESGRRPPVSPETIACDNAIRRMAKSITSGSLPAVPATRRGRAQQVNKKVPIYRDSFFPGMGSPDFDFFPAFSGTPSVARFGGKFYFKIFSKNDK